MEGLTIPFLGEPPNTVLLDRALATATRAIGMLSEERGRSSKLFDIATRGIRALIEAGSCDVALELVGELDAIFGGDSMATEEEP